MTTQVWIGALSLAGLLILLIAGMRIGFALLFLSFWGFVLLRGWESASSFFAVLAFNNIASVELSLVPLFILMGYFAFHAGLGKDIFWTMRQWVGAIRGGLAIATVLACAGVAAVSGSSVATTALMSRIAIPEMLGYGYHRQLAAGVVAGSGTLAVLIPPSILIVIYATMTETSVGRLIVAAILPGVMSTLLLSLMIYFRLKRSPSLGASMPGTSWAEKFRALKGTWGILTLFIIVTGLIYTGIATPTESAALGALGAFIMSLALRKLTRANVKETLLETAKVTVMVFVVVMAAKVFTNFLAATGFTRLFIDAILSVGGPSFVTLTFILLIYFVMGCFLDAMGMLLLTLPLTFPVVMQLGYDPIWFGIIVVIMSEVALITPPVGMNLFVVQAQSKTSLKDVIMGTLPFVGVHMFVVAVLVVFPQIALWLPYTMRK